MSQPFRAASALFCFFILNFFLNGRLYAQTTQDPETIKVGIMTGPSEIILKTAIKIAKEKYNLTIKPYVFTDYQMPNEALNSGDIDANIFQTQEFLDKSIAAKGYKIKAITNTFIYPMGIYSIKIKKLNQLKNNAVVLVPNDASNHARALALLKDAELTKLKIIEMNAAQIARSLPDADIVVLNNDFVLSAGFKFSDALYQETSASAAKYVNVIAAKTDSAKTKALDELISTIHTREYELETYKFYPGAVKSW